MTSNFAGKNSYRRNRAAILCALVGAALIFLDATEKCVRRCANESSRHN